MDPEVILKHDKLRSILAACDSVLVAYSGGVDSSLVMAVAHEQLGERSLACIGVSPSYPQRELRAALDLACSLGFRYRLIDTLEHLDPRYAANPVNRCYYCKTHLHDCLRALAQEEGWQVVVDGTNASDLGDHRPGMAATRERGVRSPLLEAGLTKDEVRQLAAHMGLPVWDKPAMACLSSRVPHNTPITPELLQQIESAEDVLAGLGFNQFRVRHHGEIARIELPVQDLERALALREAISAGILATGYRFAVLDLAGFRATAPRAGSNENSRSGATTMPISLLSG